MSDSLLPLGHPFEFGGYCSTGSDAEGRPLNNGGAFCATKVGRISCGRSPEDHAPRAAHEATEPVCGCGSKWCRGCGAEPPEQRDELRERILRWFEERFGEAPAWYMVRDRNADSLHAFVRSEITRAALKALKAPIGQEAKMGSQDDD